MTIVALQGATWKVGEVKKSLMDEFSDKAIEGLVNVVLRWLVRSRLGRKESEAKRGLTGGKYKEFMNVDHVMSANKARIEWE